MVAPANKRAFTGPGASKVMTEDCKHKDVESAHGGGRHTRKSIPQSYMHHIAIDYAAGHKFPFSRNAEIWQYFVRAAPLWPE